MINLTVLKVDLNLNTKNEMTKQFDIFQCLYVILKNNML